MQDAPQEDPLSPLPANQAEISTSPIDEAPTIVSQEPILSQVEAPIAEESEAQTIVEQEKTISQIETPLSLTNEAQTIIEKADIETSLTSLAPSEELVPSPVLPESPTETSAETLLSDQQTAPEETNTPTEAADSNGVDLLTITPPTTQAQPPHRKRMKRRTVIALCFVIVLLLGSGGLFADLEYYQPYQAQVALNARATGTVAAVETQNVSAQATDTARAQATAQVYQNIYQRATYSKPYLSDSLSQQSSANWDVFSDSGQDSCGFQGGSYHVQEIQTGFFNTCSETGGGYKDFALQIDMTIVSGDYGGIIFRAHDGFFYFIEIDSSGDYHFSLWNYQKSDKSTWLSTGTTAYMHSGSTEANQLTIVAEGSTFYFYVNQHYIDTFTDNSYISGWIGLLAESYQDSTDVAFSNEKIWLL